MHTPRTQWEAAPRRRTKTLCQARAAGCALLAAGFLAHPAAQARHNMFLCLLGAASHRVLGVCIVLMVYEGVIACLALVPGGKVVATRVAVIVVFKPFFVDEVGASTAAVAVVAIVVVAVFVAVVVAGVAVSAAVAVARAVPVAVVVEAAAVTVVEVVASIAAVLVVVAVVALLEGLSHVICQLLALVIHLLLH